MAITHANLSSALGAYTAKLDRVLHGKKHRLGLNLLKKVQVAGEDHRVPVLSDWGGGVSSSFSDAQATGGVPVIGRYLVGANLASLHRTVQIESKALVLAEKDPGKFLSETFLRVDLAMEALLDEMERAIWGDGYNAIGVISSTTGQTITLTVPQNAKYFRKGMRCVVAATAGGALRDSGNYITVSSKNVNTGVITFTTTVGSSISGITAGDYVFGKGNAANTSTRVGCLGFSAWGETPTTSESFLGLDRSTNPGVLSMLRSTGSASDIEKAITDADALALETNGGVRDKAVLNPRDYAVLAQAIGSQIQYVPGTNVKAGYSFVTVNSQSGPIEVHSSPYVDNGTLYVLDWDSFGLYSAFPKVATIDDLDGSRAMKMASDSGIEIRALSFYQLATSRPGCSVRVSLS